MLVGFFARLPSAMSALALLLMLRARTGSFVVPGLAVGAYGVATAISAPLQGRLVDRFGRARVLGPCTAAWAGLLAGLLLASGAHAAGASLVVLAFGAGAAAPPFPAVVRAFVGELIGDEELRESAYTIDAIAQELVWINGPLLVALAVAVASPSAGVVLAIAIGAVGALGLLALAPSGPPASERGPSHWAGALTTPGLVALIVPVALVGVSVGATEVGLTALAVRAGERAAAGVLFALWSAGSLLGGLVFASRSAGASLATRYRVLIVSLGVGYAPLIVAGPLWSAGLFAAVAGASIAPYFACLYALVGRLAPAGTATEAFTWMTSAIYGGAALGTALAGAVSASAGVSGPFELAVASGLLAAALTWTVLGRPLREPAAATAAATPV